MMEKFSSKTSTYERNGNGKGKGTSQSLAPQSFSGLENDSDDWDIRQILGIFRRQALAIAGVASVVMAGVTYSTLRQKAVYEGNFHLLVEPISEDKDSRLSNLTQDTALSKPSLDYESQIQVLKSPELMAGVIKELQPSYPGIDYSSLINSLAINRIGETKVIEIRYQSNDPRRIKFILDKLSKYYLNYSFQKRKTKLRQGIQFVETQLPSIKKRVNNLQTELQEFRQKYNFIDPQTQATQLATRVNSLAEQRQTVNQQLAMTRANFRGIQGNVGELAALNSAALYQQLLTQLRQIETQIAAESTRFQDDNPSMQSLREKRQTLLPLIQQEAERILGVKSAEVVTQIQILEVQSEEINKVSKEVNLQVKQLPVLARKYTELQQELQIAAESLNRFLTTRETLQIENAQTELPWELIQAAVQPQFPISPNIQRSLILGLVGSVISGIGVGIILEKTDNTYHNIETIKEKIKLPLLGVVPLDKNLQKNQNSNFSETKADTNSKPTFRLPRIFRSQSGKPRYHAKGQFWEALQVLYSNIQLLSSDQPIRSLAISSAMPGDGKSTVAFHLAQIAAAMGKRVLLVDADLRRPQIHHRFDLNNLWGLTSLISTNMPMEQVIQQLPEMDDVSVITSGPTPPDPARLLSSEKMKQLMAEFHESFDLVIYDVPPIVGLVDVRLLAPYTDGIVLVVRMDQTDKLGLKQAQDSLRVSPINVLGVVVNADKTQFKGYDHYYSARK
jgi:polysaccharide biosynthesis transport protein